jgi:hypothetical protein
MVAEEEAFPETDYRDRARGYLARAVAHVESGDNHRLVYAALEARMAIESLTYDLVRLYRGDVPPSVLSTWQPAKLFKELLAADPDADSGLEIHIAGQDGTFEGTDTITLKEHRLRANVAGKFHSALGSFLHEREVAKLDAGKDADFAIMRRKVGQVIIELERVLASSGFNLRAHHNLAWACDCSALLKATMPFRQSSKRSRCASCLRTYELVRLEADIRVRLIYAFDIKASLPAPEWQPVPRSFSRHQPAHTTWALAPS